ncbi:hypothetical protein Pelo_7834 [Pelomyxa schiedti]|nr:hypothetical protein Pelo_7834 [Pelomyxa schiedti]
MLEGALFVGSIVYVLWVLPRYSTKFGATSDATLALLPAVVVLLLIPFLCEAEKGFQWAVTVLPVMFRAMDIAFCRVPDPTMLSSGVLNKLLFLFLPDTSLPINAEEKSKNRRHGIVTLLFDVPVNFSFIIGLLTIHHFFPTLEETTWMSRIWWSTFVVCMVPAMYSLLLAIMRITTGYRIQTPFNYPLCSRTPKEFWTRKWNLVFRSFAHRHIFTPVRRQLGGKQAGLGGVLCGIALTFFLNGLMHEYVMLVQLRRSFIDQGLGDFFVFLILQFCAVAMEIVILGDHATDSAAASPLQKKRKVPPILGTALTLLWLFLSSYRAIGVLSAVLKKPYSEAIPWAFPALPEKLTVLPSVPAEAIEVTQL